MKGQHEAEWMEGGGTAERRRRECMRPGNTCPEGKVLRGICHPFMGFVTDHERCVTPTHCGASPSLHWAALVFGL